MYDINTLQLQIVSDENSAPICVVRITSVIPGILGLSFFHLCELLGYIDIDIDSDNAVPGTTLIAWKF